MMHSTTQHVIGAS